MIFVDSGAWISLLNPKDRHYNAAVTIYNHLERQRAPILTTDYVIDETITRLRYDVSHPASSQIPSILSISIERTKCF